MKYNLLKRALPFVISLIVGITLSQLIVGPKFHRKHRHRVHRTVEVKSVPFIDFPVAATEMNGLRATITLRALFDADGKVKEISNPELEEFRRKKAQANLAHPEWVTNEHSKKAVESTDRLVDRLVDSAVQQLQQVVFRPGRTRGAAVSQWVNAQVTFRGADLVYTCDSIQVLITDDRGKQLWQGETLKDRPLSCSQ
jgi:hypothetical protein